MDKLDVNSRAAHCTDSGSVPRHGQNDVERFAPEADVIDAAAAVAPVIDQIAHGVLAMQPVFLVILHLPPAVLADVAEVRCDGLHAAATSWTRSGPKADRIRTGLARKPTRTVPKPALKWRKSGLHSMAGVLANGEDGGAARRIWSSLSGASLYRTWVPMCQFPWRSGCSEATE